jgi:hypothetical protein
VLCVNRVSLTVLCSGELDVPICPASIDWVCGELLMTLDSTVYFTTSFSECAEEVQWKRRAASGNDSLLAVVDCACSAGGDAQAEEDVGAINSTSHPGVLLPLFLGQWIIYLARQYHKNQSNSAKMQLQRLIRALTATVCGADVAGGSAEAEGSVGKASTFKSLSAVKWVLRVFSFEAVQECLMYGDSPICCIGQAALVAVTAFIKEKFFTMSRIITVQVYAGLVPLLLCTRHADLTDLTEIGMDLCARKSEQLRVFMDMMSTVGLHNILSSQKGWRLLKLALLETIALRDASSDIGTGPSVFELVSVRSMHASYTAVWMGIVGGSDKNTTSDAAVISDVAGASAVCKQMFQSAGRLYTSSYISVEEQWRVLWFLRGATSFLCGVFNAATTSSDARIGSATEWVYQQDYSGNI